jgi:hypothetical protein
MLTYLLSSRDLYPSNELNVSLREMLTFRAVQLKIVFSLLHTIVGTCSVPFASETRI